MISPKRQARAYARFIEVYDLAVSSPASHLAQATWAYLHVSWLILDAAVASNTP